MNQTTDSKDILKKYMLLFPGSFVGFFEVLADVLASLGLEWIDSGEKEWGQTFVDCAVQCANIAGVMIKLRNEFDKKNAESNPIVLVEQHLEKVKNAAK